MKKVLIYETRHGMTLAWDASTPKLRELALLELFKTLERYDCYQNLPAEHFQFYNMAKRGNATYAEALLILRKQQSAEEYFREVSVTSVGPQAVSLGKPQVAQSVPSGDLEQVAS